MINTVGIKQPNCFGFLLTQYYTRMGELAIGSNALQWSQGNHEVCSIDLEADHPDLLQIGLQGVASEFGN